MPLIVSAILCFFSINDAWAQPKNPVEPSRRPASINPSFVSFYGKRYLVKSAENNCNEGVFKDHGETVRLCIDSAGNPFLLK
jgi:hypothetical protein